MRSRYSNNPGGSMIPASDVDAIDNTDDAGVDRSRFDPERNGRFAGGDIENTLPRSGADGIDGDDRIAHLLAVAVEGLDKLQCGVEELFVFPRGPHRSEYFPEVHRSVGAIEPVDDRHDDGVDRFVLRLRG